MQDDIGSMCKRICQDGLGRSEKKSSDCDGGWMPLSGACYVHAFATKNPYGVSQGDYMQKCMQEYCIAKQNGPCNGNQCGSSSNWNWWSLLSKSRRVKKHGTNNSWGMYPSGKYVREPKMTSNYKKYLQDGKYYCAELCHNTYHPVIKYPGSDMQAHPGTWGCTYDRCDTQDKCNKDCNKHWEKKMKPIFDEFCECPGATTKRYATSLLETGAAESKEEPEPVDVGAFIQTSMSDKKAEEL